MKPYLVGGGGYATHCPKVKRIFGMRSIVFCCRLIWVLSPSPVSWDRQTLSTTRTAKTQYRKFETNFPRKGTAWPQSQFPHSCVCERDIYFQDRSAYSAAGKYVDRSQEYINRSPTHECRNWDCGRAIPFLGIHKCFFIALWSLAKVRESTERVPLTVRAEGGGGL